MENFDKIMKFDYEEPPTQDVRDVLSNVHRTSDERGYNAVNQTIGYLLSGDPMYIPCRNKVRNQIRYINRDVTVEELASYYSKKQNR